ncbi:MAG: HypC/HybG/HupF family hydrogenase formation chaperone, partial [Leptolyngbya sp.]|nr:HypC/HybG/HupF family hydrogenase formation chaperone [Leptolyngbya sp.]
LTLKPSPSRTMCLGIPGQIQSISDPVNQLAIVDISGVRRPVNIACIVDDDHPLESCVGEWVLVHVGFALNRIDPDEAAATLALLDQLAEWDTQALTIAPL